MTELEEKRIVQQCNIVLAAAGLVATVRTLRDVSAVCSSTSIFVATFEALGGDRLEGTRSCGRTHVHMSSPSTKLIANPRFRASLRHVDTGLTGQAGHK